MMAAVTIASWERLDHHWRWRPSERDALHRRLPIPRSGSAGTSPLRGPCLIREEPNQSIEASRENTDEDDPSQQGHSEGHHRSKCDRLHLAFSEVI
jgi:hypothetical protein